MARFNTVAIIRKLDWFYECGKPAKARRLLLEPWPAMDQDINCLYQHLVVASRAHGQVQLFLKSAVLDDDGLTYQFPDWTIAAGRDLVARYGEAEGRLRHQKAMAVFASRHMMESNGLSSLEEVLAAAAEKMTLN